MIRILPATSGAALALCVVGSLLAGCGQKTQSAENIVAANAAAPAGDDEVEALPSDGLAAPEGMAIDRESNTVDDADAPDSGGNGDAM